MSCEVINPKYLRDIKILPKGPRKEPSVGLKNTGPTPYSREMGEFMWSLGNQIEYPYASSSLIAKFPSRYNALAFFLALDAYYESGVCLIPPREVMKKSFLLGPSYAKHLKDLRYFSFVNSIRGVPEEPSTEYAESKLPIEWDIGAIFNYRYLYNWKEETDDFNKYAFIPVPDFDIQLEDFFVRNLPATAELFNREEVLFRSSSSKTLLKGQAVHNFLVPPSLKLDSFSEEMKPCKLVKIQKTAGDPREIVILDYKDLNTVLWIDNSVKNILSSYKENMMISNLETFEERLTQISKKTYFESAFYVRDLKKEGWTKPRKLLKLLLSAINTKYDWKLPASFFDSIEVFGPGFSGAKPTRGHGLGMANSLTTLLYILLFKFACSGECSLFEDENQLTLDCIVLNDDFLAYGLIDQLEEYKSREFVLFEALGIILNKEKSYTSVHGYNFAEYYFNSGDLLRKSSYWIFWSYLPLLGWNIRHAKVLSSCLEPDEEKIKVYKDWFGYEFFPEEYRYSFPLGGWSSPKLCGVDVSLAKLDHSQYKKIISKVAYALDHFYVKPSKIPGCGTEDCYLIPEFLLHREIKADDLEILGYKSTYSLMKQFIRIGREHIQWNAIKHSVYRIFQKTESYTYEEFLQYYLTTHKNSIPPVTEFTERARLEGLSYTPPEYSFSTPNLDYLAFLGKPIIGVEYRPSPFGLARDVDSRSRIFSSAFRSRIHFFNETMGQITLFGSLPDWFLSSYESPVHVAAVLLGYTDKLPFVPYLEGMHPESIRVQEILQKYPICRENFSVFNAFFINNVDIDQETYAIFLDLITPEDLSSEASDIEEEIETETIFDSKDIFESEVYTEVELPEPEDKAPMEYSLLIYLDATLDSIALAPAEIRSAFYRNSGSRHSFLREIGIPSEFYESESDAPLVDYTPEADVEEPEGEEGTYGDVWSFLEDT